MIYDKMIHDKALLTNKCNNELIGTVDMGYIQLLK